MNIIKKANKQNRQATVADGDRLMNGVAKLVAAGRLSINQEKCEAAFKPEDWEGKPDEFKRAWCTNILTAWCIQQGVDDRYKHVLVLFDIDKKHSKLGTFSLRTGFVPWETYPTAGLSAQTFTCDIDDITKES